MWHVKELLGHENLDTLQHYARLTITNLKNPMQNVIHENESRVETGRAPLMLRPMPMTLKELYTETRQLPREQAAELIDLMLADAFSQPESAVEAAWGFEIDRRLAELESGQVQAIPGEQVMAEIRQIVGL